MALNEQTMSAPSEIEKLDEASSESRRQFFPGWTMLGIASVAQYMSAPGQSYSVAAFKDPMRIGLGLTETDYSLAYGFATLVSACLLPGIGRLVDRFGARIMLPLISAGLTLSCLFMSFTENLGQLYFAFSCVRSLGQGALTLVSVWLVGEWFERRRGMATAIAGMGGAISVMTVPLINNWLIAHYGWQIAWQILALAVGASLILPGLILIRDRPELLGLQPDGLDANSSTDEERSNNGGPELISVEDSWTVRQVLRDLTFWKLLSVPATAALVATGLIFHQVLLLGSHGLSSTWALGMLTVQAGFATLMTFPAGWATDRFETRYILCAAMGFLAGATLLVITMPATWLVFAYAIFMGAQGSIFRSAGTVVWINYYGRVHQGAVRGMAWSVMILASALGPLPLALSIDHFGSYNPALWLFLALPVFSAIAVMTAQGPRPAPK